MKNYIIIIRHCCCFDERRLPSDSRDGAFHNVRVSPRWFNLNSFTNRLYCTNTTRRAKDNTKQHTDYPHRIRFSDLLLAHVLENSKERMKEESIKVSLMDLQRTINIELKVLTSSSDLLLAVLKKRSNVP